MIPKYFNRKFLLNSLFILVFIFSVSGCGLLQQALFPKKISNVKAGTAISSDGNILGESNIFTNVKTLEVHGEYSGPRTDPFYGHIFTASTYYKSYMESYPPGYWDGGDIYLTITSTIEGEYLPPGNYYLKINDSNNQNSSPTEGGELTFTISVESSTP